MNWDLLYQAAPYLLAISVFGIIYIVGPAWVAQHKKAVMVDPLVVEVYDKFVMGDDGVVDMLKSSEKKDIDLRV